jgi:hypothetical protein
MCCLLLCDLMRASGLPGLALYITAALMPATDDGGGCLVAIWNLSKKQEIQL